MATLKNKNAQFSLGPAILIPFHGFSTSPIKPSEPTPVTPSSQTSTLKVNQVVICLLKQQNIVRGQMIALLVERAHQLRANAQEQITAFEALGCAVVEDVRDEWEEKEREKASKAMDHMWRGIVAPLSEDREVLYAPSQHQSSVSDLMRSKFGYGANTVARGLGDDTNTSTSIAKPNQNHYNQSTINMATPRQIREKLSCDLQMLIENGTAELRAYDAHCRRVMGMYQDTVARKTSGAGIGERVAPKRGEDERRLELRLDKSCVNTSESWKANWRGNRNGGEKRGGETLENPRTTRPYFSSPFPDGSSDSGEQQSDSTTMSAVCPVRILGNGIPVPGLGPLPKRKRVTFQEVTCRDLST